jgi:uncharacterized protein
MKNDDWKTTKTTIITDPVYQVMDLGGMVTDRLAFTEVLDTQVFQRLRRISQLGLASYVFPGATHTRFSHSLGVYYLAYTVMRHLKESSPEVAGEIDTLALEVKLCGLLHDVGHGPFSHSFEQVLQSIPEIKNAPLHEDWTAAIIKAENSEVQKVLQRHGLNTNRMASIFSKTKNEEFPLYLKQIVSSQIDVDRMDYLVRDSHFAGVAIGKFDIQYLINSLVVIRHGNDGPKTLGIRPKGVKAYEAFAVARQFMNRTVYYHHKVKVLEHMMERFIRETLINADPLTKVPELNHFVPPYFRAVTSLIKGEKQPEKDEFLKSNLKSYIELTEDSVWTLLGAIARCGTNLAEAEQAKTLAQKLLVRQVLPYYVIEPGKRRLLERMLKQAGFESDKDFAIVEQRTTTYKAGNEENVFVEDVNGEIDEILDHSELITLLRDKAEEQALLVVMCEEKRTEIERTAKEMQGISLGSRPNKKRARKNSI